MAYVSGQEGDGATEAWWHRPVGAWGPGQRLLACGAAVVAELRAAVRRELGYSCSAGGCTLNASNAVIFACALHTELLEELNKSAYEIRPCDSHSLALPTPNTIQSSACSLCNL